MSTTNYNCDQCGKPCTAKTVIYNRYKTHFCGKECKADHQKGAKDRAKDERIRELENEVDEKGRKMDRLAEMVRDEAAENARLRPCEALVRVAGMDLTRLLPAVVSFSKLKADGKEGIEAKRCQAQVGGCGPHLG